MSRPSDGMTLDELRDEFDWMFEFQSRMAERIRQDADVHNLVDYVTGLEAENRKLRAMRDTWAENDAKLRELVRHLYEYRQLYFKTGIYPTDHGVTERCMRELGIREDG